MTLHAPYAMIIPYLASKVLDSKHISGCICMPYAAGLRFCKVGAVGKALSVPPQQVLACPILQSRLFIEQTVIRNYTDKRATFSYFKYAQ